MAALSNTESRRLYSWWWDSHISPKNSKWLQENLTDMDAKVKAMIKLIEEDADSFARRAEMYYKKRPELMKLVEEFYRAYRALAERYNHATVELRHAHRTMSEAFPNQVPCMLAEDSPSESSAPEGEPHTPRTPHPIRSLKNDFGFSSPGVHPSKKSERWAEESDAGIGRKGLDRPNEMFMEGDELPRKLTLNEERLQKGMNHQMGEKEQNLNDDISQLSNENQSLKTKVLHESERAGKAESEVENLKKTLAGMEADREAFLLRYQQNLEKISNLEEELNFMQAESRELDEQASKAKTEVRSLKELIVNLEAERDAGSLRQKEYLERISDLESMISVAQNNVKELNELATKAEVETQYLKKELSRLESEKETVLLQYQQCLQKISDFEDILSLSESEAKLLTDRADRAEIEVIKLEKALAELNGQKEVSDLQCNRCLEKISKLESAVHCAQEDLRRLNTEILMGAAKLKIAEEKHVLLETSNQSLMLEAENLAKRIAMKDQELLRKHEELENVRISLQNEHLHFVQIEATLHTLQNFHSESQEEQRSLALELKNGIQMLKGLVTSKHGLEEEIRRVKDENQSFTELNSSSSVSIKNLESEILTLREMKERLEEEVELQIGRTNNLQREIDRLKNEIKTLNVRYQSLMEQVELSGLNPESIQASVTDLRDENSELTRICKQERDEKEALLKKLASMEKLLETNATLESSLSDVNGELEVLRQNVKTLTGSSELVQEEKNTLITEKASLLSQLQDITQNMVKLMEKNAALENSLSSANAKLEGLREKSKSLEDICQLLNNEKSNLVTERGALIVQLEHVESRLEDLEKRFKELEAKHADLGKNKETAQSEVEKLRVFFGVEKKERESFALSSDARLASLENRVHLLQDESRWRKKDSEEDFDKVVNAQFEMFILKKFMQEMEEKNYSLLIECQKHIEASRMTETLISELERENLEQQVEAELLLDDIAKLRMGIYQVFKALDVGAAEMCKDNTETDKIFMHLVGKIKDMRRFLSSYKDDKQRLWVENSVLLTIIEQIGQNISETELEKQISDRNVEIKTNELVMVQSEKNKLLEMNKLLTLAAEKRDQKVNVLEAELESSNQKQRDSERAYLALQENFSKVLSEKRSLLSKFYDLKEEQSRADEDNEVIILELLTLSNLSVIFKSFGTEKAAELKSLDEDLHKFDIICSDLEKEVSALRGKLEAKEMHNLLLKDSVKKLDKELRRVRDVNYQLMEENSSGKDFLRQKERELSEAEEKVKTVVIVNEELSRNVEGLKKESEESRLLIVDLENQIEELYEEQTIQNKEIAHLRGEKENLASELDTLHDEFEEHRIREESLISELQQRNNDAQLWESEAASFYFDLQISSVREILLENRVHELTGVCENLEDESASKTVEIEQMKEKVCSMESDIGGLKSRLSAYAPLIVALRENVESLEQSTLFRTKRDITDNQEAKVAESAVHLPGKNSQEMTEDQNSSSPNGISDLQELRTRIKLVEKVVVEEMERRDNHEILKIKTKPEAATKEIKMLKSKSRSGQLQSKRPKEEWELSEKLGDNIYSLRKTRSENSEARNVTRMKDIQLDQVLEGQFHGIRKRGNGSRADDQLLEIQRVSQEDNEIEKQVSEPRGIVSPKFKDVDLKLEGPSEVQIEKELGVYKTEVSRRFVEPIQEGNKRKILERLASDAQKLTSLKTTVQDLRRKLDANKKNKKAKSIDFETVKEQLEEFEETVVHLVDMNGKLTKNVKEGPWCSDEKASAILEAGNARRKRITEQARKESEQLGRLQLEVQKVQYVLLKFDDEKKSKSRTRFFRTKTSIILRDFIHGDKRASEKKKKKSRACGCWRPSPSGGVNASPIGGVNPYAS